jgi:peptidoglycan/xylan/chitin deacetylase (PgdA/CDA1 family)
MKRHLLSVNRVVLACVLYIGLPTVQAMDKIQEVTICKWKGDKQAAASFTMDDGFCDIATVAAPMLERYGWRGTFFVVIKSTLSKNANQATWAEWKELARRGHEIASHSWTHCRLKEINDPAIYQRELVESRQKIAQEVGITPLTFAYPSCAYDAESKAQTEKFYIRARAGGTHTYGRGHNAGQNWTAEKAISDFNRQLETGGWHLALMHNVGRNVGYRPTPVSEFTKLLDRVKAAGERVWVDTYANVSLYIAARDMSSVERIENGKQQVSFVLKLAPDWDPQFPVPYLTVKYPLAEKPTKISAFRPKNNRAYYAVWENGFITVDLPPDNEAVTLSWY